MPKRAEKKLRKRSRVESSDREDGRAVMKETPQPLEQTDGAGVASSSRRRIVPSPQNRPSVESDDEIAATDETSQSLEVTDDAGISSSSRRRTVRRSPVLDCGERPLLETRHNVEGTARCPQDSVSEKVRKETESLLEKQRLEMAELREELRKLRMENGKQNSSEGSNSWSKDAVNRTDRGDKAPLPRLGKFDGTEPLRSFLDQFERFCQQFHWDANERAFQLHTALKGKAAQCLWGLRDNATAEDMIQALKSRYGDSHLIDQYRAQLHDRKRKDGESISDLCDDLSQLLVLGFPNADEETRNYIGKDVFFRAIEANANLQMWVRDREPRNLEDCRTLATKAEANASISNYKAFEIKENRLSKRVQNIEAEKTAMPDTAAAFAEGSIDPVSRLCSLLERQLNANAEANAQLKSSGHQEKEQHFQNAKKKQRPNRKQLTAAPTVPVALPSMPALQASTTAAVATPPPPQVLYWPQPQQTLPMNAPAFTTSNAYMTPAPAAAAAMAATKPSITCCGCQQVGHIKRNCPYLQPQQPSSA
jgi:hypothetical protein